MFLLICNTKSVSKPRILSYFADECFFECADNGENKFYYLIIFFYALFQLRQTQAYCTDNECLSLMRRMYIISDNIYL